MPRSRKPRDNTAPTASNCGHSATSTPGLRSSEGDRHLAGVEPACALVHDVRDPALPRDPEPLGVTNHFGEDAVAPRTPPLLEEPVPACPSPAQSIDGGDSLRPPGEFPEAAEEDCRPAALHPTQEPSTQTPRQRNRLHQLLQERDEQGGARINLEVHGSDQEAWKAYRKTQKAQYRELRRQQRRTNEWHGDKQRAKAKRQH